MYKQMGYSEINDMADKLKAISFYKYYNIDKDLYNKRFKLLKANKIDEITSDTDFNLAFLDENMKELKFLKAFKVENSTISVVDLNLYYETLSWLINIKFLMPSMNDNYINCMEIKETKYLTKYLMKNYKPISDADKCTNGFMPQYKFNAATNPCYKIISIINVIDNLKEIRSINKMVENLPTSELLYKKLKRKKNLSEKIYDVLGYLDSVSSYKVVLPILLKKAVPEDYMLKIVQFQNITILANTMSLDKFLQVDLELLLFNANTSENLDSVETECYTEEMAMPLITHLLEIYGVPLKSSSEEITREEYLDILNIPEDKLTEYIDETTAIFKTEILMDIDSLDEKTQEKLKKYMSSLINVDDNDCSFYCNYYESETKLLTILESDARFFDIEFIENFVKILELYTKRKHV